MTSTIAVVPPAAIAIARADQYPHVRPQAMKSSAFQYMWTSEENRTKVDADQANLYARIFFTQGQCHALALAIESLTDCTLMGLNWHGYYPDHVFVKLPSGIGLDICGLFEEGQHPDEKMRGAWKAMTNDEVNALENSVYAPACVDTAMPYAQTLVDWYC